MNWIKARNYEIFTSNSPDLPVFVHANRFEEVLTSTMIGNHWSSKHDAGPVKPEKIYSESEHLSEEGYEKQMVKSFLWLGENESKDRKYNV